MLRNGCLTLCQFHIPNEVMFIYKDVVTVLLKMLRLAALDEFLLRIGVLLLNSLACQVENEHKMLVGEMKAVETMIDIIGKRYKVYIVWLSCVSLAFLSHSNIQIFYYSRGSLT